MTWRKVGGLIAACTAAFGGAVFVWQMDGRLARWLQDDTPGGAGVPASGPHSCSMHPQVVQEGPGQCPICGMDLTPVGAHPATEQAGPAEGVRVSSRFVQNFAVRSTTVERSDLRVVIRTVGYLEHDEGRLVSVTTKVGGWIEAPRVNTVGEQVSQGDILFEIYSPELVTAQDDFLAAIRFARRLVEAGAHSDAVQRAEALVDAASERLRRWDLTTGQIDALRTAGAAVRTIEVPSPASGYLVGKMADSLEGIRAAPGTSILKIADHSTLWARVEFYEHHLRDLEVGLGAEITLDAFPRRTWTGTLLFFEPAMNPQTQTLTGYVEVRNSDGRLRPKMHATVEIRLAGARNALTVPSQAVLRSGRDLTVVVVDAGDGLFSPREVVLGIESEGRVQVLDGLREGERIVTSSQFLLDSESNLQAAIERLGADTVTDHQHGH